MAAVTSSTQMAPGRRIDLACSDSTIIAGVDGCKAGWLCLTKSLTTGSIHAHILRTIHDLLNLNPRPALAMVDVPIGLPDAGSRECDLWARKVLRPPRASSVFPAPIRPILTAISYLQACDIGARVEGRKLSKQTWAILPKIREADEFLRSDATRTTWVREIHPEVSFWAWNENQAMAHGKKTLNGRMEREALVRPFFGEAYTTAQASLPRSQYSNDDLLDAFAALWSGERLFHGKAITLPANPPIDSFQLRMEIVA